MQHAFQKMQLQAPSFYARIDTWAEMKLLVTDDGAHLTGYFYDKEIADAFSTLIDDWEATIPLPESELGLEPGTYELGIKDETLHAFRKEQAFSPWRTAR